MSNGIFPKRSTVANKVPTTSSLAANELAINSTDQKIYTNNGTAVVQIGSGKLAGLADVALTSLTNGQSLTWNGTNWVNTTGGGSGTVTSVAATAGTGISVTGSPITTSGTLTITNTAPDQTVVMLSGTGISVTGTYPNFTVTNAGVTAFNSRTGSVSLSSSDVTGALGFTPYNATNPSGYISSITSGMVTTALGYTPYNSSNPSGYITSSGTAAACSGNSATVSSITGNTNLMVNSLAAPAFIDGLTTSNFRTTLFNTTSYGYQVSTSRWNSAPSILSSLNSYGTMLAWSGSDTHGFLAMEYNAAGAIIGGGNAENINWYATLLHSSNYNSYSPTLTGTGASGTWGINISGTATYASHLNTSNGSSNWYWSGQGGQPSWLWGGNDGTNFYVYNPSNFSVNYANSAGSATTANNGAKIWVNFNGVGTVSIRASYNVSSVTRNGTGDYTVNFSITLADTNYAPTTSIGRYSTGNYGLGTSNVTFNTTSLRINTFAAGGNYDLENINIAIFR